MALDAAELGERLAKLREQHGVPGAAVAVLDGGEVITAADGMANLRAGIEATPDTLFQIGSITKVYTATLVMQLVDEGVLDLDAPITRHLPDLRVQGGDPETFTARHLLTHTVGIDGDVHTDFGRGEDILERFVASLADLPMLHAPSERFSYCNAGFVVLGRLIEVLSGETFPTALRTRLLERAGLAATATLPDEVILHRAAVGHLPGPDGTLAVAPVWSMTWAMAPAGSMTAASAADLVAFARLHLDDGRAADGTQVLSAESARAMRQQQVALPPGAELATGWGLGWFFQDWQGTRVVGHDGDTVGQSAYLRLVPEEGVAVGLLTNGGQGASLYRDLFGEVFGARLGIHPEEPSFPEEPPTIDHTPYLGTFRRQGVQLDIAAAGERLELRVTVEGPMAALMQPIPPMPLTPTDEGRFLLRYEGSTIPLVFSDPDGDGRPAWLLFGGRSSHRV